MSTPMPDVLFHATADGSPFGAALCGYKPEGGEGIWVTQIPTDINCVVCRSITPPPNPGVSSMAPRSPSRPVCWLFWALVRQPLGTLVPTAAYYWLLDRLTDNNGWRPLFMRGEER